MKKSLPRGIRNNNPGNIERANSQWQGLAEDQSDDPRFAIFKAPAWGIRALARTLITYFDKYGINTVRAAINRWAPPVENDTGSYVMQVSRAIGVSPDAVLDFHDYKVLCPMVQAIIRHENGNPTDYGVKPHGTINGWYDATTIDEGLKLAGVVKQQASVATVEGAAAATTVAAGGGAVIAEVVTQLTPALTQVRAATDATNGLPTWLRATIVCLTLVAVIGAAVVLWQKRKQAKAVQ